MAYPKKTRSSFIAAYRRIGTIEGAAKAVGISREVHYDWKRRHADYKEAFEAAAEPVADLYVDEVVNRSIHGWIEPVFSNGKRAIDFEVDEKGDLVIDPKTGKFKSRPASILRKSDACLLALCAARVPGFGQRSGGGRTGSGKDEDDRDIEVTVVYKDKPIPTDDDDDE